MSTSTKITYNKSALLALQPSPQMREKLADIFPNGIKAAQNNVAAFAKQVEILTKVWPLLCHPDSPSPCLAVHYAKNTAKTSSFKTKFCQLPSCNGDISCPDVHAGEPIKWITSSKQTKQLATHYMCRAPL